MGLPGAPSPSLLRLPHHPGQQHQIKAEMEVKMDGMGLPPNATPPGLHH